jgi:hypothetical protein
MKTAKSLREWAQIVKERDGHCVDCGSAENLHAHHVKRKSQHPELSLDVDNGVCVCLQCHAKRHDDEKHIARLLLTFPRRANFSKSTNGFRARLAVTEIARRTERDPSGMTNRDNLCHLQKTLGLSNQDIADALDLSLSAVQKYRAGALPVPLPVILAMRFLILDRAIQSAK